MTPKMGGLPRDMSIYDYYDFHDIDDIYDGGLEILASMISMTRYINYDKYKYQWSLASSWPLRPCAFIPPLGNSPVVCIPNC